MLVFGFFLEFRSVFHVLASIPSFSFWGRARQRLGMMAQHLFSAFTPISQNYHEFSRCVSVLCVFSSAQDISTHCD